MMAGKVDEVVPPACARAFWEAAGRPPIRWYDCGHYSAVGFLLPGIRRTVDFFAKPGEMTRGARARNDADDGRCIARRRAACGFGCQKSASG